MDWREEVRENPKMAFGMILAALVVTSFFIQSVTDAYKSADLREQNQRFRTVLDEERTEARKERAANREAQGKLLDGQQYQREELTALREQLQAVLVYIGQRGVQLPARLLDFDRDNDDDDGDDNDDTDDGDDSRPKAPAPQRPTPRPTTGSPGLIEENLDRIEDLTEDLMEDLDRTIPSQINPTNPTSPSPTRSDQP